MCPIFSCLVLIYRQSFLRLHLGGNPLRYRDSAGSSAATLSGLLVISRTARTPSSLQTSAGSS